MPHYIQRGEIPPKRHTRFQDAEGNLRYEEHVSRQGFAGVYSNLYHLRMASRMLAVGEFKAVAREAAAETHRHRHLRTANVASSGDALSSRRLLLFNQDAAISKAHVDRSMSDFYRNSHADELLFVQSGSGTLHTNLGRLHCVEGDYLIIPRGIIWQLEVDQPLRLLVLETRGPLETPERYRNKHGQFLEASPYCERDLRLPEFVPPINEEGEFKVQVALAGGTQTYTYAQHPFDVVGWDGANYPWAFNISDFEPITGRIHQPPPVHQTFQAPGMVICSFVPRLFDYHPDAIPAPYYHSNVESDEVIFYSRGEFMSRKGIEEESITLHPAGLPHGPQPGMYEGSIGKRDTNELAVMIDTFAPLQVAKSALAVDDPDYPLSWLE